MKAPGKGLRWLLCWAAALLLMAALTAGILSAAGTQRRQAAETLERSLKRAALCCYSIEGRYPPSADYLAQRYGVYVDGERFLVYYEAFADNIMPYVEVRAR